MIQGYSFMWLMSDLSHIFGHQLLNQASDKFTERPNWPLSPWETSKSKHCQGFIQKHNDFWQAEKRTTPEKKAQNE